MLTLHVLNGTDAGVTFRLNGAKPEVIGRRAPRLKVNDTRISRQHCEFSRIDGTWTIRDLGSSNGTFVNGTRIARLTELEDGDELLVGRLRIRVMVDEPASAKRPKPRPQPTSPQPVRLELDVPEDEGGDASVAEREADFDDIFEHVGASDELKAGKDLESIASSFADSSVALEFNEEEDVSASLEQGESRRDSSAPADGSDHAAVMDAQLEPLDVAEPEAEHDLPDVEQAGPLELAGSEGEAHAAPAAGAAEQAARVRAEREKREAEAHAEADRERQAYKQARAGATALREQRLRTLDRRVHSAAMRAVAIAERRAEQAARLAAESRLAAAAERVQAPAAEPEPIALPADVDESPAVEPIEVAAEAQEPIEEDIFEPEARVRRERPGEGPGERPGEEDEARVPQVRPDEPVAHPVAHKEAHAAPARPEPQVEPVREFARGRRYNTQPRRGRVGKAIGLIALLGAMGTVGWLIFVDSILDSQPVMGRSGDPVSPPSIASSQGSRSPDSSATSSHPRTQQPSPAPDRIPGMARSDSGNAAPGASEGSAARASGGQADSQASAKPQTGSSERAIDMTSAPRAVLPAMASAPSVLGEGATLVGRVALEGRVARNTPAPPAVIEGATADALLTPAVAPEKPPVASQHDAGRAMSWNSRSAYSPGIAAASELTGPASPPGDANVSGAEVEAAVPPAPANEPQTLAVGHDPKTAAEEAEVQEPDQPTLALATIAPRETVTTARVTSAAPEKPEPAPEKAEPTPVPGSSATALAPEAPAQATTRPQPANAAAPARRVAFLLDASGSTVDTLPRMVDWLGQAIDKISPRDQFVVIFFRQGEAVEAAGAGLKPGHSSAKREVWDWVQPDRENFQAFGRSDPEMALRLALSYGVSEVYLLSDDTFGLRRRDQGAEGVISQIERCLDSREAKLHTVQFFYRDDAGLLESIARQFGGTYEFIQPELVEQPTKLGEITPGSRP